MEKYYVLSHSGIKGMRWGRRRYQNPDGSLTPEGKIRYARMEAKEKNKQAIRDAKTQAKVKKILGEDKTEDQAKKVKPTSDAEQKTNQQKQSNQNNQNNQNNQPTSTQALREEVERVRLEQEYARLTAPAPSKTKQVLANVLGKVGNKALDVALNVGANAALTTLGNAAQKKWVKAASGGDKKTAELLVKSGMIKWDDKLKTYISAYTPKLGKS